MPQNRRKTGRFRRQPRGTDFLGGLQGTLAPTLAGTESVKNGRNLRAHSRGVRVYQAIRAELRVLMMKSVNVFTKS